jgi:hypothetical protein
MINGVQSKTNLSGGTEDQLKDGDSTISETIARNLLYSYPDSTERLTNLKQRTVTIKSGTELITSIAGTDIITSGPFIGTTGVSLWGKIWNGKDFYVQYRAPKVYKTCSGSGKIVCADIFYNYKGAYTKNDVYGVDKSTGVPYNTCGCLTTGYYLLSTVTTPSDSITKTLYPY